ncbi:phosphotransferase [Streptomyces sp. NPDC001774]
MTAPSRITVMLHALDPIYRAGVVSLLRPRPEIPLVDTAGPAVHTQVALVVTDTVEEATLRLLGAAAPRLVASCPTQRAVVLTAVGGRTLHGDVHPPEQQRRIFHRIGQLAASLHHSAPPLPAPGTLPLGKLERHLAGALPHLAPGDAKFIRATAEAATELAPLERVPTHGDFLLRNLRGGTRLPTRSTSSTSNGRNKAQPCGTSYGYPTPGTAGPTSSRP